MDIPAPTNVTSSKTVATDDGDAEETIETVRSDKSQVTIANFFNGDKKISAKAKKQAGVAEPVANVEDVVKKE
jgi:hypothetical protein